jgi:hypothetical protein
MSGLLPELAELFAVMRRQHPVEPQEGGEPGAAATAASNAEKILARDDDRLAEGCGLRWSSQARI